VIWTNILKKETHMDINEKINNLIDKYNYNIGIYFNDLKGNIIAINENKTFETASCIKLFILIEYYRQVNLGLKHRDDILIYTQNDDFGAGNTGIISSLSYGLKMVSKDYATLMIIRSDNIATNKMIDYLGLENINNTIKELGFEKTKLLNKIDFTKYEGIGISTPYEYGIVYQKILMGEIFNKNISNEIFEILKKQQINDVLIKKLPLLDVIFKGTKDSLVNYIASKSGWIADTNDKKNNVRNDGGIISTVYGEYIISIFILGFDCYNHEEVINCASEISKIIFDNFINEMKQQVKEC